MFPVLRLMRFRKSSRRFMMIWLTAILNGRVIRKGKKRFKNVLLISHFSFILLPCPALLSTMSFVLKNSHAPLGFSCWIKVSEPPPKRLGRMLAAPTGLASGGRSGVRAGGCASVTRIFSTLRGTMGMSALLAMILLSRKILVTRWQSASYGPRPRPAP